MINIKEFYVKQIKYFQRIKRQIEAEIKYLPKGVVSRKKIKAWHYYYLCYRKEDKVVTDYIGKRKPLRLIRQARRRQELLRKLYEVDNNLYALGAARRISRGSSLRKRFEILKRDKFTCQYCGRSVKKHNIVLVVDHIHPKRKGGEDNSSNFITSCSECNLGKRNNLLKA